MILFSDLGVGLGWSTAVLVFFNSGISILTDFRNTFRVKKYSETLNNEYIERIHQMSYSSLSDNGMLQIFSFLIK